MRIGLLFLAFFTNFTSMAYARGGFHCCDQRDMGVSRIYGIYHKSELRYVGQTTHSIRCRLSNHISKARKSGRKAPVVCWIRSILDQGLLPEIKLIEEVPLAQADERERFWITLFKTDRMKNFSDGGNMCGFLGKKHSAESRRKMKAAAQNRIWSMTEAAKKRLSQRNKCRKQSSEEIEKRRQKMIGQKRSAEFCKKASERMLREAPRKAVVRIDVVTGEETIYPSIREAAQAVGVSHPGISLAAKRKHLKAGGFQWRYADGH